MIKAIITALEALSTLLDEIKDLIDQLEPVPAPVELLELQHERILDVIYFSNDEFDVPRNMNIISMLPIKPELATTDGLSCNVSHRIDGSNLKTSIWYY